MIEKQIPRRLNSLRLHEYDYSGEGAYFVTIVTHGRAPLFGRVINGEMELSEFGRIVEYTWHDLVHHNSDLELDEFVVMPNHIHGIVIINSPVVVGDTPAQINQSRPIFNRAGHGPAPTTALPEVVRQLKTFSAKRINQLRDTPGVPVWQRNFYDHIIRDEKDYDNIVNYIFLNPQNWSKDDEYKE